MLRWTNVTKINGGNAVIKKEHCTIHNIIQNKNKNQVLESNVPKHLVKFGSKICKHFYQNDLESINGKKPIVFIEIWVEGSKNQFGTILEKRNVATI